MISFVGTAGMPDEAQQEPAELARPIDQHQVGDKPPMQGQVKQIGGDGDIQRADVMPPSARYEKNFPRMKHELNRLAPGKVWETIQIHGFGINAADVAGLAIPGIGIERALIARSEK